MLHGLEKGRPLSSAGFNRTGFVVCSYLCEAEGCSVAAAMEAFAAVRPPGVKHIKFIDELYTRYGDMKDGGRPLQSSPVSSPPSHVMECVYFCMQLSRVARIGGKSVRALSVSIELSDASIRELPNDSTLVHLCGSPPEECSHLNRCCILICQILIAHSTYQFTDYSSGCRAPHGVRLSAAIHFCAR